MSSFAAGSQKASASGDDAFPPLPGSNKPAAAAVATAVAASSTPTAARVPAPVNVDSRSVSEPAPISNTKTGTASSKAVTVPELLKHCGAQVILRVRRNDREREVQGRLLACDLRMVSVAVSDTGPDDTVMIFHVHAVAGVKVTSDTLKPWSPAELNALGITEDSEAIQWRRDQAIIRRREESAKIGVGVTPFGQALFDALSKTMTCHWKGSQILVYDVLIQPPYTIDNCISQNANSVARVRKMLSAERSKVEQQFRTKS